MTDGLRYHHFDWPKSKSSHVHIAEVDLTKLDVAPMLAANEFPFKKIYPVELAIAAGSVASVGGGFNLQWSHHRGIADEPLHAMVIDNEIWTTGIGAGGVGLRLGDGFAQVGQNRIQVHIHRPDHSVIEVEHVNFGNDGRVVAFTERGGTNEYAGKTDGKYYTVLSPYEQLTHELGVSRRPMRVDEVRSFDAPDMIWEPDEVVLESKWPLRLLPGDEVQWVQRLGQGENLIQDIVSGWPLMVNYGENNVKNLNLDPEAPNGPDNWFVRRNPRMAVGVSANEQVLYMFTVEGRIPGSPGVRLKMLANLMIHHGCFWAVNFDGGGSAFMWLKTLGLVAPGCYNTSKTIRGLRPDHYSISAFPREK